MYSPYIANRSVYGKGGGGGRDVGNPSMGFTVWKLFNIIIVDYIEYFRISFTQLQYCAENSETCQLASTWMQALMLQAEEYATKMMC